MAIGNPVGYKVMRSLLVIPEEKRHTVTGKGLKNKLMFIAELMGFKSGTINDKAWAGWEYYLTSSFHENIDTDSDEMFENIWLERLYEDIDNAFGNSFRLKIAKQRANRGEVIEIGEGLQLVSDYKWQVPIEIDMSASVLGIKGLLLNHKPFLDRCNIIGDTLGDAWAHDIIKNRKQFKTIMRQCYGSQMSAKEMWTDMKIPFTQEEVDAFNHEMKHGDIAVAVAFKDFCINNCNMEPEMEFHIGNEKFKTFCNRFHNVGEITTVYDLYDSATDSVRRIHNTSIKQVPDLKGFKRYSVTGLIHNLDSQVLNATCNELIDLGHWVIPIHDAMIVCCESATLARDLYANGKDSETPSLKWIHTNRNKILQNYFRSIGIKASAMAEWKKVMALVEPLEEELIINPMVLK